LFEALTKFEFKDLSFDVFIESLFFIECQNRNPSNVSNK